jgi:hypothetical protein
MDKNLNNFLGKRSLERIIDGIGKIGKIKVH